MRTDRRNMAAWLISLAVALTLTSCAIARPSAGVKHAPPTATQAAGATGFICANPAESNAQYAYVNAQKQLYLTQGCNTPTLIAAPPGHSLTPIAFARSGGWLLVWNNATDAQAKGAQNCLALIDLSSMRLTITTSFCDPASPASSGAGQAPWYSFIGWSIDEGFYLSETSLTTHATNVDYIMVPSLASLPVTKFTWVANLAHEGVGQSGIELSGDSLYYAGYMSTAEGGAWLHRFSLSTQTDTRIMRLGVAGLGGCQVDLGPCQWTGPWDISAEGTVIVYHSPGPTQSITDTSEEPGTPLVYVTNTGAQPTRLFPNAPLGRGFNAPELSPNGQYVAAMFGQKLLFERLDTGAVTTARSGLQWQGWPATPGVALVEDTNAAGSSDTQAHMELYNLLTGALTPLQVGCYDFVWD